jgi:hypothetical protein
MKAGDHRETNPRADKTTKAPDRNATQKTTVRKLTNPHQPAGNCFRRVIGSEWNSHSSFFSLLPAFSSPSVFSAFRLIEFTKIVFRRQTKSAENSSTDFFDFQQSPTRIHFASLPDRRHLSQVQSADRRHLSAF